MGFCNFFILIAKVLQQWQTLIAGICALVAAYITIKKMQDLHTDSLKRKEIHHSVEIVEVYPAIEEYFLNIMRYLVSLGKVDKPIYPEKELKTLRISVEYMNSKTAKRTIRVLNKIKTLQNRINNYTKIDYSTAAENIFYILDIYAGLEEIYLDASNYANNTDTEFTKDDILEINRRIKMKLRNKEPNYSESLYDEIEQRIKNNYKDRQ